MELGGGELKNGGSWLGKHSFKTQGSRFYLLIFLASYLPSFLPTYLPTYLSYLNDFLASYLNLPTCITYQLTVYLPNVHNLIPYLYLAINFIPLDLPIPSYLSIYLLTLQLQCIHDYLFLLTCLPSLPDYYKCILYI